jgi:hypothetical protein
MRLRFSINASSGALGFVAAPNYEAPTDVGGNNIYDVTVQVSDGGGLTSTRAIAVTVTPVNDNTPAITSSATASVAENTTAVLTVTATDADLPAQTLSFSIVGGADAAKFSINSSTGALSFVTAPNYESPTDAGGNNVDVTVQVSDGQAAPTPGHRSDGHPAKRQHPGDHQQRHGQRCREHHRGDDRDRDRRRPAGPDADVQHRRRRRCAKFINASTGA